MATYYEVTIIGTRQSEQIINRMNFTSDNDAPESTGSSKLLVALGHQIATPDTPYVNSFFDRWLAAQTVSYQINEVVVRNLFSVTDFITQPMTGVNWSGKLPVASGDGLLSFAAAKLRTNRVRTDVRRGTLALTGGTEEHVEGADVWNSAYMTLLSAVATALNNPPTFVDGVFITRYFPSVFGKERYPVPNTTPQRYAYRYYQDITFFAAHAAVGVTWSAVENVASQVSRKIGRGA